MVALPLKDFHLVSKGQVGRREENLRQQQQQLLAAAVRELAVKEASPVPIESVTAVPAVQNRGRLRSPSA